jgi:hypothetical protein
LVDRYTNLGCRHYLISRKHLSNRVLKSSTISKLYRKLKRGRPPGFVRSKDYKRSRSSPEDIITAAITSHPDLHEAGLRKLIVDQQGLMKKGEFYKTIQLMTATNKLAVAWKGNKKIFRIADRTEPHRKNLIDIPGHLGRLSEEVSRLRREYNGLVLFDKIPMSVGYMRNNLNLEKELSYSATVSGCETKEFRDAISTLKAMRQEIIDIVSDDADKDKVLPRLIAASPTDNDFGIYRISNQVDNSPVEMFDKYGNLVYRNFPPYVNLLRDRK